LIQGENYPPYVDGLPQYITLQNKAVTKLTGREFKV
jgi:6-phosphofructokinase 1